MNDRGNSGSSGPRLVKRKGLVDLAPWNRFTLA